MRSGWIAAERGRKDKGVRLAKFAAFGRNPSLKIPPLGWRLTALFARKDAVLRLAIIFLLAGR